MAANKPKPNTASSPGAARLAMSVDEACAAVGVCRTTIYKEIAAGRLAVAKAGKRTLILASELERWLASLQALRARAA